MKHGSVLISSLPEEQPLTCLALLGDDDAQQRTGRGDSFVEVVIVVDGEEVSVHISVAQLHVRARDAMDGLEETVEFQKASRAVPLQTEAAIFRLKLVRGTRGRPVSQLVQQQLWRSACNQASSQLRQHGVCETWIPGQNFNTNMEEREKPAPRIHLKRRLLLLKDADGRMFMKAAT